MTIYINCRTCKSWRSSLYSSLNIFRCCRFCCWSGRKYSWCIFRIRSNCCCLTISIGNSRSCLNCNPFCCSNKIFFRSKCHSTSSRIDCICPFACYCLSCFISRLSSCWIYQFLACDFCSLIVTQIKCWSLSLRNILNVH